MSDTLCVIGDGGWGTALALVLARNGHQVRLWSHDPDYSREMKEARENTRYLAGVPFPDNLSCVSDPAEAISGCDAAVIGIPSKFYRGSLSHFEGRVSADLPVINVSKGLLDGRRLSECAQEQLGLDHMSVLSGPSHAEEVAREAPTAVTIASSSPEHALKFQEYFNGARFRVYSSSDVVGVELGGALKNVIAIAAGVCDGLGFGDNSKAALITRGLAELMRVGHAMGGRAETFTGLSGVGDLIVTCGSTLSRNRGFGERIGKGETREEIESGMLMVAEGVFNAKSAYEIAQQREIECPIIEEVYAILYEGRAPKDSLSSLLARDPKPEHP